MKSRLIPLWENLRTNFWFVPSLMAGGAVLLAAAMLALDEALRNETIRGLGWVYGGGPEGARSLLSTVAGSVITVAGTTFSITIAALTLASSQFGPRLLRNFVRDRGNQMVLGAFIATFLYCLLILRTIHGEDGLAATAFVPHLAVSVAIGLAIVSVGVLIYFIHHIATAIQVDSIITTVSAELHDAIDRLFPEVIGQSHRNLESQHQEARPLEHDVCETSAITAAHNGYLQAIDADAVLNLATEHDLTIELLYQPGDFVVRGTPLARVWSGVRFDGDICRALNATYVVGKARTQQQDTDFAINQLVEIAVRALSPGVNDPFTAITCVDRLGAALCHLAGRDMPSAERYDDAGRLRVIAKPVTFADLVDASFNQIRQYGRTSVAVAIKLLETIQRIGACCRNDPQRAALLRQAEMIWRGSQDALPEAQDRADVARRYEAALQTLGAVERAS